MPRVRLSMRKISEVFRLKWERGRSHREIAQSCGIGTGTVSEYVRRAKAAGLGWPLPEGLTEGELEQRLFPPPAPADVARPVPDWAKVQRELKRKGVTRLLLWEEYRQAQPTGYGYTSFCQQFAAWEKRLDVRMRQTHRAGEKLFVDYAGLTVGITDPQTGEVRAAQVFVATLGASNYTFAEVTWGQTSPDWLASHVRAFAFFGGVPEVVVPDNLKTGIHSPCRYEPDLNRSYLELARHYHVAVLPARVRKPRDKAKVENGVQQVERRVLAPLRDRTFFSLAEANEALAPLVEALNQRPPQGLPASRSELFLTLDQPALRPLPAEPFQLAEWRKARVNIDYHVSVDDHWYSVPYGLVKEPVEVRLTSLTIELYHQGVRVASHPRSTRRYHHTTQAAHLPPAHRAYAEEGEWTAGRFLAWACRIGPATTAAVTDLLASREFEQQAYRSCLGLLRLGKEYGAAQLEAACSATRAGGCVSYKLVKRHMTAAAPTNPSEPTAEPPPLQHENLRGADYFSPSKGDAHAATPHS